MDKIRRIDLFRGYYRKEKTAINRPPRWDKYEQRWKRQKALIWSPGGKEVGRSKKNWPETITDDLNCLGMRWDEAGRLAMDGHNAEAERCSMCSSEQEGLNTK